MLTSTGLRRALPASALTVITLLFGLRVVLLRRHAFDPDEFQHLHGAWCVAKGLLPYRDYFDHHTPWMHFFLAPFLAFFDVETSPHAAESFIFFARSWMLVFSGLALALTYRLGRAWEGPATGWTGTLLLSTSVMFLDKTLEIRPDVPAVAFLLGSWAALLDGMLRSGEGGPVRGAFVKSGILLGVALLCTQKLLFTLPASALTLAWYVFEVAGAARRGRWRDVFAHAGGVAAPIALVLALFAARGGLWAFVEMNLLVNLRWPVRFSAEPRVRQLLYDNGLLVALAAAGLVAALVRLARDPRAARALVPLQALGLAAGAFVIPVPTAQYLVPALPPASLLAGSIVAGAIGWAGGLRDVRARAAGVAVIVATVAGFSVRPLRTIAGIRLGDAKVEDHLGRLRYVLTQTRPGDVVMDGFSGLGVFRPHAYFCYFLHDEIRVLLAGRPMSQLLAALRDGTIAPEWVIADRDVLGLPANVVAFLRENYAPTGVEPIWRRRDPGLADGEWLDLGDGPRDVLAGRGWSPPERDAGRAFRRGAARRSTVRLPVRDAAGCRTLVLRARNVSADAPASVEVAINGVSVGSVPVGTGWSDHPVALGGSTLRRGVNSVQLSYDPPEAGGAVAVAGLGLRCGTR